MLVLASASPARHRLLQQAGIEHRVQVSGVDEDRIQDPVPTRLVCRLALAKAEAVAAALASNPDGEGMQEAPLVLGCDSLLVFEGEVFGKPRDAAQAMERWRRMAGRCGELHTGHVLLGSAEEARQATVTTRVHFAALEEEEIAAYVASGEPLATAGGFALEGRGGLVVEHIEGCVSNVIGLSLPLLRRWLQLRKKSRSIS